VLNDPGARTDAQQRENVEPSERVRPIPLAAAAVTLAMVLFGVGYLLSSESLGSAELGDRRTVADLAGAPAASGQAADGRALYAAHCAACHQPNGKGLAGVFPPLDGSEWVNGDARLVSNILLHGVSGEIEVTGVAYRGAMPAFGHLGDAQLAAVASWVRSQWSNRSPPVDAAAFARERKASARSAPFDGGAEVKALAARSR
jgi:mono/diheme cytochrome c family protein